ncbi:MAG: hypothetical protein JW947_08345 [Sedimentisphaerales bacterium]|nr:hypothetical protein [Sedimentisphaerales bacterium]
MQPRRNEEGEEHKGLSDPCEMCGKTKPCKEEQQCAAKVRYEITKGLSEQ